MVCSLRFFERLHWQNSGKVTFNVYTTSFSMIVEVCCLCFIFCGIYSCFMYIVYSILLCFQEEELSVISTLALKNQVIFWGGMIFIFCLETSIPEFSLNIGGAIDKQEKNIRPSLSQRSIKIWNCKDEATTRGMILPRHQVTPQATCKSN